MNYTPDITDTTVRTGTIDVGGLNVFYREAGKPGNPKLVLLHGFPASSHQYRDLLPALAPKFHVVAMDYPGFGNSDMPDPTRFAYTFDKTSEVVEPEFEDHSIRAWETRAKWHCQLICYPTQPLTSMA
jgi:pimeloyl-ACP methyl ester carboxylesterase